MTDPFASLRTPAQVTSQTAEIDGHAQCVARDCRDRLELRPLKLRVERVTRSAPGLPQLVESTTDHTAPVSDSDIYCPSCGQPSAILTGKPASYQTLGYPTRADQIGAA